MDELVSIIMPTYNSARYIAESIHSILAQTYTNWELIIVDDASTDDTEQIITPFLKDSRIRYMKNPHNYGAAETRNHALREAWGKWIAFLDSDDLWMPEKLERQITFMKANGFHFSYTRYAVIDAQGNDMHTTISGPTRISDKLMQCYNWMGCLTVMYDADHTGLVQIADIRKNNDYALWLKICKKADCHLLNETLAMYRRGRSGSIRSHQGIAVLIKWQYRLYREAEGSGRLRSLLHTIRHLITGVYKKVRYSTKS